jgi:hypothetical protein
MKKWFWAYIAGFIALTGADLERFPIIRVHTRTI